MKNGKAKKIIFLLFLLFFITACRQQKTAPSEKRDSQITQNKKEESEESIVSEATLLKIIKKEIPADDYLDQKIAFESIAMSESSNRESLDGKRYIQVYIDHLTYFLMVKTEGIDEKFQFHDNITVVGTIKGFESAENDLGKTEVLIIEPDYLEDSNGNQYKPN
ncbi:hypothetical protein [Isobaculum melis]|uniref:tRNA_anti-like n=1 Tax=Isobaculum melis TaxID=142588 RepID=A0A1H9RJX3_9LACT|nr:hypothetical protein [Isobaculum melis]SER73066.1 hypothetical protein SAMN04488559_104108 [Isobaculum melis]